MKWDGEMKGNKCLWFVIGTGKENKLHGCSLQANYTDPATAAAGEVNDGFFWVDVAA
jgi:hypothetical protein